eukprot:CAMPEP_0201930142 /NCGR_PEP_ID=MMETSP0903-20130614/24515_1 /ASSEMBLY_ACC=CAM_ASM_000552 /TAXON_ID=420261 /ORGANISM="Thalassiosira antarctica, Strain CCMP982" /LENGTH=63 /DNA_ID=CAMNT_0048469127 /DNA_START=93 /DNA_END=284 /DNA_ORIENTATION=+
MANKFKLPMKISSCKSVNSREFCTSIPAPVFTPISYPKLHEFNAAQKAKSLVERVIFNDAISP